MTKEQKFAKGIVIEKDEDDYVCEIWGGSTKHPDLVYRLSKWGDLTPAFEPEYQIFQWLLWIASQQFLPMAAEDIAKYALENWVNWG